MASSINTLLSLTPCLIFPPFYHSRSLRRRLPVGGSVLPVAGKKQKKKAGQVVDCVFILAPRLLFVSQKSCLCFYYGLILFKGASGRYRGSHPFPLKTCQPDRTLVRLLLVCHYRPFPQNSRLGWNAASRQRDCRRIKRCISEGLLNARRRFCLRFICRMG